MILYDIPLFHCPPAQVVASRFLAPFVHMPKMKEVLLDSELCSLSNHTLEPERLRETLLSQTLK